MKKTLSIIKYALLAVSVLTVVSLPVFGVDKGTDIMMVWAYILLGLTLLVSIIFPLINLATNPKAAVKTLIGLGVAAVIVVITYFLSSTEPVVNSAGGFFTDPATLRITDIALYITYLLMGVAILAVVYGEIRNSFK